MLQNADRADSACFGLGFDAGGTRTRWALSNAAGVIVAEGEAPGFSALQMETDAGRIEVQGALAELARQVWAIERSATGQPVPGMLGLARPMHVHAGLTGFGGDGAAPRAAIAAALRLAPGQVALSNDIEIAYHDVFAPGEGYLVYAGTGSIAAFIDSAGEFHRAGGRGYLLDDGGGGRWIAREALRAVWRAEDEQPGSWPDSPMACAIFGRIGGDDWAVTRQHVYAGARGELGELALAVAQTADRDPVAHKILEDAGRELGRLGQAMIRRYGMRPFVLSGRAVELHPAIEASFRAALPAAAEVRLHVSNAHCAAARLAVRVALAEANNPQAG